MGFRGARRIALTRWLLAGCLGLVAALPGWAAPVCSQGAAFLQSPGGAVVRIAIEIADAADERAQGLMNRESLPASAGMLFVYPEPKPVSFWMKNTLIPLDMLFLDASGVVTSVHSMARPLDETGIKGGDDVQFVIEINGGMAKALGLVPGTALLHPAVPQDIAKWPCPVQ